MQEGRGDVRAAHKSRRVLAVFLSHLAPPLGPAGLVYLVRATDGEGVRFHRLRDHGTCRYVRTVLDANRRNERRIAADKHVLADNRRVLLRAIVITRDCSGADIYSGSDGRISEIGEVVRLGAAAKARVFQLDKVSDVTGLPRFGIQTQPGEGANR